MQNWTRTTQKRATLFGLPFMIPGTSGFAAGLMDLACQLVN
jgi:hypothetical protein